MYITTTLSMFLKVFFLCLLCSLSLCLLSLSISFSFLTKQFQRNLCHVFNNYSRKKKERKKENIKPITLCFNYFILRKEEIQIMLFVI